MNEKLPHQKLPLVGVLSLAALIGCSSPDETLEEPIRDAGVDVYDSGTNFDSGSDADSNIPLDPIEELIYCLMDKNMEMFSEKWCGACQYNIELFEPYWYLMEDAGMHHDCSEEKELCAQLNIEASFPLWMWDRNNPEARYSGLIQLHCFEQFVGCTYNGPAEGDCPDEE